MRGSVPLAVSSSIEGAGFTPITHVPETPPKMIVNDVYSCLASRCGEKTAPMLGSLDLDSSFGGANGLLSGPGTIETMLLDNPKLRASMAAATTQRMRAESYGVKAQVSPARIDARGVMRGSITTSMKARTFHARYIVLFRGNSPYMLMSASASAATAARYARIDWLR